MPRHRTPKSTKLPPPASIVIWSQGTAVAVNGIGSGLIGLVFALFARETMPRLQRLPEPIPARTGEVKGLV